MGETGNDRYDAVVIGAGIGGLVCGCYLAKAGLKVLIVEQHHQPGGYCTSFQRKGFTFDAAAHSFGGYRQGGIVRKVLEDTGIAQKLSIERSDPSDVIVTPDHKAIFWSDVGRTTDHFQSLFPAEAAHLKNFFHVLLKPDPQIFARMRSWTFKRLLDHFFSDEKLKAILAFPLLGNGGLPPSLLSAFVGAKMFAEYLLDGGYYPKGGMQSLPDALAAQFKAYGGTLRLRCKVDNIMRQNHRATGVVTTGNERVPARFIIANCDTWQLFSRLLGRTDGNDEAMLGKIKAMKPTLSMFVLYAGLDRYFDSLPQPGVNMWLMSEYDLDKMYRHATKGTINHDTMRCMVHVMPEGNALLAFMNAPFKDKVYWDTHKTSYARTFVDTVERYAIPGLSNHIVYQETATPHTLYRYTLNYQGAAYGWESTPEQLADHDFRKPSWIDGLYCTGHWATLGLGIPGVFYIGYDTARLILKKVKHH